MATYISINGNAVEIEASKWENYGKSRIYFNEIRGSKKIKLAVWDCQKQEWIERNANVRLIEWIEAEFASELFPLTDTCQTAPEYYGAYMDAYIAWAKGEREFPREFQVTEEMRWQFIDAGRPAQITVDMVELSE